MITETSKQAYKELNEDGTSTSQKNKILIKEYSKKFNELSLLKAKITSFVPREQINAFKLRCFIAEFTLPESFEEVLKLNEEKS